jgi:hypothetical protein
VTQNYSWETIANNGVGRRLTTDSFTALQRAIFEILGQKFPIEWVVNPGVNYTDRTCPVSQTIIDTLLGQLVVTRAAKPLTVPLRRVTTRKGGNQSHLIIKVGDVPSELYPVGHVIAGERMVAEANLAEWATYEYEPDPEHPPHHKIALGSIAAANYCVVNDRLKERIAELPSALALHPFLPSGT